MRGSYLVRTAVNESQNSFNGRGKNSKLLINRDIFSLIQKDSNGEVTVSAYNSKPVSAESLFLDALPSIPLMHLPLLRPHRLSTPSRHGGEIGGRGRGTIGQGGRVYPRGQVLELVLVVGAGQELKVV